MQLWLFSVLATLCEKTLGISLGEGGGRCRGNSLHPNSNFLVKKLWFSQFFWRKPFLSAHCIGSRLLECPWKETRGEGRDSNSLDLNFNSLWVTSARLGQDAKVCIHGVCIYKCYIYIYIQNHRPSSVCPGNIVASITPKE